MSWSEDRISVPLSREQTSIFEHFPLSDPPAGQNLRPRVPYTGQNLRPRVLSN